MTCKNLARRPPNRHRHLLSREAANRLIISTNIRNLTFMEDGQLATLDSVLDASSEPLAFADRAAIASLGGCKKPICYHSVVLATHQNLLNATPAPCLPR